LKKIVALPLLTLLLLVGCSGGGEVDNSSLPPGAGKPLNPSGELTPEQQDMNGKMQQGANAAADRMAAAAKAEQEAKSRNGN
jgi:hypothetical protein